MNIILNDFKKWRARRFLLFCICMFPAVLTGVITKNSKICVIMIVLGLGVYGYLVEQAFMNKDIIAEIKIDEKNIYIKTKKKIYIIQRQKSIILIRR